MASFEDLGVGAKSLAMGEAFIGLANSSDAVFLNPAGLARLEGYEISTFYSRPFGVKEMAYSTMTVANPTSFFVPGMGIQTYGFSVYRENSIYFSAARQYQKKFFYGVSIKYLSLSIKNYGSQSVAGIDLGFIVQTNEKFAVGCVARNINRPRISQKEENLPQVISTGLAARPVFPLLLTFDIYKDVRFPLEARAGMEYQLIQNLFLRAGLGTEPARYSLGFGLNIKSLQVHYAYYAHQVLSATHQISITFSSPKNRYQEVPPQPPPTLTHFTKTIELAPKEEAQLTPTPATDSVQVVKKNGKTKAAKQLPRLKSGETINLNTATPEELQRLPGIGKKTAEAIIKYRTEKGQFVMATELTEIKGIGVEKFKKIEPFIRLKE